MRIEGFQTTKFLNAGNVRHSGIPLSTADPDFAGQAQRINSAVSLHSEDLTNALIRVNRPAK